MGFDSSVFNNRRVILVSGLVGVVIGVLLGTPLLGLLWPETPTPKLPDPKAILAPHLESAKAKSEEVIEEHLLPIRKFFNDSKRNTLQFAGVALGWGSKWRLIVDNVPYTKGARHEQYIADQFKQTVFGVEELESIVKTAVEGYTREIDNIENQMLVSMRADIVGLPESSSLTKLDAPQLKSKFEQAVNNAITASGRDLQATIGTQLVSIVVGEVLTQAALRLGVSAAIIGPTTWATLGVGVVVGMIVDQLVSWVWDWWADPQGELASKINHKLDEMCELICEGAPESAGRPGVEGLRQRFQAIARERAGLRESAVLELLSNR